MMRLKLQRKGSLVFSAIFLLATLFVRFLIEPYFQGHWYISMGVGLYFLMVLYALYKARFLNFER